MPGEQDLKLKAKLEGEQETSGKLDRIGKSIEKVGGTLNQIVLAGTKTVRVVTDGARSLVELGKEVAQLTFWMSALFVSLTTGYRWLRRTDRGMQHMRSSMSSLTRGAGQLVMALTATWKAFGVFHAGGAAVSGIIAIVAELRREIAERQRLIGVIKEQSAAMDQIKAQRRDIQADLERTAGERTMGGFADVDVSRKVTTGAQGAKQQFGQLQWSDIINAFAQFGDIAGFSQQDLTNLAIVASFGELQVDARMPAGARAQYGQALLQQHRQRIEAFAQRETAQGAGFGRGEYRPEVTERAQEIIQEGRTEAAGKAQFRKRLAEVLPAGADIELAVRLYEMHGTAAEVERQVVGAPRVMEMRDGEMVPTGGGEGVPWFMNPMRDLLNELKGMVTVLTRNEEGYWNQLQQWTSGVSGGITIPLEEFRMMVEALKKLEREAGLQVINHNEHARIVYPDAAAVKAATVNGESDRDRRAVG